MSKDSEVSSGGPRVTLTPNTIVINDANQPVKPGSGQVGRMARGGHIPLGYYEDPVKTATLFAEVDGKRYATPGDLARIEADGTMTLLGRATPASTPAVRRCSPRRSWAHSRHTPTCSTPR